MRLDFTASPEVRLLLDSMGRTEDVSFSPSGRRLAIAEFGSDRIVLLDIEITASRPTPSVVLTDWMAITSPSFREPHGVSFLDEETLVIANRAGGVSLVKVPPAGTTAGRWLVAPPALETLDRSRWFHSPGSLAIARVDGNCYDVLVCNNYADYISRHRVDASGLVVTRNELLLAKGLALPDGIAVNPQNRWIAVSSHRGHQVLLYRYGPELNPQSEADGILRRVECPHGVRFTQDDNFVLVADAGAPFVHVYAKDGDSWHGERDPVATCRVLDDATFLRGRYNPTEGGPKGIDIDRAMRVVVTTCEHQPLAFFGLAAMLAMRNPSTSAPPRASVPGFDAAGANAADHRPAQQLLASRLARCPCGSGKRFKHCCGQPATMLTPVPPSSFGATMTEALAAQKSDSLERAETLYREALEMRPDDPDALHMLGVVCHCRGRSREAATLIRKAGEGTAWRFAAMQHNYALALGSRMLGRSIGQTATLRVDYDRWLAQRERNAEVFDADPLVSVVVPVYNHAGYVMQALETVFAQTYRNLELIVVDDGSTDGSADVVSRALASCPFPVHFVKQGNRGAHAALNEAIRLARGTFVNPLNSDDLFEPTRIAGMVEHVARRGFEWGFGNCMVVDREGTPLAQGDGDFARQLAEVEDVVRSADTVGAAFLGRFNPAVSTGNLFFAKALHERLGGFRELRSNHDWDFCLRALKLAEPCFVRQVSYRYRRHEANTIAESAERNLREANALFAAYYASVIDGIPANRFAPARATMGWRCFAKGFAVGQVAALAPELLVRLHDELDAEDERSRRRAGSQLAEGLNVVGYLRGDFGLAEAARGLSRSCRVTGIEATFHDADVMLDSRQSYRAMDAYLSDDMPHRNTLLYLNPDSLKQVWQRLDDRGELRNRHRIGYWFWEIDAFPTKWRPALDLVDEVWVATDFVGDLVRRATDKPVIKIPHAVDIPPGRQYTRAEFGLPQHRFLFLFTFDFHSFSARKNPRAAIEAFALAFPAGDDRAGLVIKCSQGYRYPEQLAELQALAARDPRIVVLDRVLSSADVFGLQGVCDAYVSLHRSEGLGLGMAECMAQGKPVIATAYSGNLEFMTDSNSCLVGYALVPVRPGEYIDYEPGWLWADPAVDDAARYMERLVTDPTYRQRLSARAAADMANRFNHQVAGQAIVRRLVELAQLKRGLEAQSRKIAMA